MGQFFKYLFASLLGTLIGLTIFSFLGLMIVLGIVMASGGGEDKSIADNSVLRINLEHEIEERSSDDIWGSLSPFDSEERGTIGLLNLRQSIRHAKSDDKIKGIFLDLHNTHHGFASLEELRNALIDFKSSGKFIVAYSETYSEGSYYLASVADKIFLPSSGLLEFNGLNVEMLYFKGTLEKLQIKPEVFKVGEFKSAVEPFLLDKMSDANRTQIKSFLNSIYNTYLENVAKARGVDAKNLADISSNMLVRNAEDALKYKLITDVGYLDEAGAWMRTKLNKGPKDKIDFISFNKYEAAIDQHKPHDDDADVAVIFASGDIQQGKGNDHVIGSEKTAGEIRKARMNDKVKAIVLRINSPGGSAIASDIIWREIDLASKTKPVIASMSDVAASGGYYIAMACDTIVAQPTTITGSIGVFGLLFNGKEFLKEKLGITTDGEKTGKYSDLMTFTRELTDEEKSIIQLEVEKIYGDFTTKAAQGRNMNVEDLRAVAEGRVWSGSEAKKIGLIDLYGGLDDAIDIAAKKAKLAEGYSVSYFPEQKNMLLKQLFSSFNEEVKVDFGPEFSRYYPYIKTLKDLEQMEGVQARLPYKFIIK
ncbi:MAG: signal peptide peptidase SppA [Cytophagaceae bacterium]